jgi:uncharacterized protein (DUF2336 family)
MASKKEPESQGEGTSPRVPMRDLAQKLAADSGSENRTEIAGAIGATLDLPGLSAQERAVAADIIKALASDLERTVRAGLARAVAESPNLDPSVAKRLAVDDVAVAEPILKDSTVLSDADLAEIVREGDEQKQLAIAGRALISEALAGELVEHGSEPVVVSVVANPGAVLDEPTLGRAVDRFGESERLHEPLLHRSELPVAIAERMVSLVSDKLREELVTRHALPDDVATDLILETRERATLALGGTGTRVEELVTELHRNGRLTGSIMTRAACTGDIGFLEAALARRAGVETRNARQLIHDPGKRGFDALIGKADLPPRDRVVLRCAIDVVRETEMGDQPGDRERFGRTVIERVLTTFDADQEGVAPDDADYLIHRLESYMQAGA